MKDRSTKCRWGRRAIPAVLRRRGSGQGMTTVENVWQFPTKSSIHLPVTIPLPRFYQEKRETCTKTVCEGLRNSFIPMS